MTNLTYLIYDCETHLSRDTLQNLFEMAAMPFPCNGILVAFGNLPRIFPVSLGKYISCLIMSSGIK